MSFEQDFLDGYKKYSKNFDKWCERAYPVLGKITQCGILELDKNGYGLIATNRADFGEEYLCNKGYLLDSNISYITDFESEEISVYSTNRGYKLMHLGEDSLFGDKFGLHFGFIYRTQEENNIQRFYFFGSDTPEIYNEIINNLNIFKKFLVCFKNENKHIISYFRDRKFNISEKKDKYYFTKNYRMPSERARLNSILHTVGVLERNEQITPREWQCLELYCYHGMSADKTGEILGISRRTVESHFNNLKIKLKVDSKVQLIDTIS